MQYMTNEAPNEYLDEVGTVKLLFGVNGCQKAFGGSIKVEYADMIFDLGRNMGNRYRELKFALGISDRSVM
jgi:hypothetical protein